MTRAVCAVRPLDIKRDKNLMLTFGLNEAMYELSRPEQCTLLLGACAEGGRWPCLCCGWILSREEHTNLR